MKLIKDDQRTAGHLKTWARGKKLYVSGFYFWCSGGNEIQMTLEGLLRTLIHQALHDFPQIVPLLFPKRLETFVVFGNQVVWEEPWTLTELLSAFKQFVHETTKSNKIFLLIDGLDEFNGNYSQQVKLIEFIQSLLSSDVKLCVSSRPWNVFEDAFNTRPSLRLEDLTYKDIQPYCSSNLSNNLGFAALQRGDPKAASDLIENVSTKASGVFLWVILVVQSLHEGLTDGERLSDLQKRLDSLPADLETLFWRIIRSVDFERISQLFQIVRASPGSMSLLELSYADEDNPDFVFKMATKPLPTAVLTSRAELMRRRLNACSKGLLEPQGPDAKLDPHAKVGYLHRTVKDFIQKADVWDRLLNVTSASFYPGMRLSVARIAHLKITHIVKNMTLMNSVVEEYAFVAQNSALFWGRVVESIRIVVNHGPKAKEIELSLLEELKETVDGFVARSAGSEPICYENCPSTASSQTPIRSFFYLAVKLQLVVYIRAHISDFQGPDRIRDLSVCLRIAITDYECGLEASDIREPSLQIVEMLLEHGATLDDGWRINNDNTTWQHVLEESRVKNTPDLLMLLLRYGADPFEARLVAWETDISGHGVGFGEVFQLAKAKREETMRNGRGPKSTEDIIVAEDNKPLERRSESKWFRLRSRFSSNKRGRDRA